MSFKLDIQKFAKKAESSLDEACRAIKISLFNSIIMDTRVKTGRLRGNWQTSTGAPITEATENTDKSGRRTTKEVEQRVTGARTVDYFTNNLPYAEVWEENDGMLSKNLARISRIVKETVR